MHVLLQDCVSSRKATLAETAFNKRSHLLHKDSSSTGAKRLYDHEYMLDVLMHNIHLQKLKKYSTRA